MDKISIFVRLNNHAKTHFNVLNKHYRLSPWRPAEIFVRREEVSPQKGPHNGKKDPPPPQTQRKM